MPALPAASSPRSPRLADEAQAAQAQVEDKQGVYCKPDPVLHNTAAAEDADTGRHRPGDEHQVDRDPGDLWQVQRRQEGGDDDREECVPDDADALRERAVPAVSVKNALVIPAHVAHNGVQGNEKRSGRTHIFPPSSLI